MRTGAFKMRTKEDHKKRHEALHEALDELLADFIFHTRKLITKATIWELLEWSAKQTENPTETK
jgi:hypothetical protein